MPKLKNSVPKYRKHRASGQAVVTLSGVDHCVGVVPAITFAFTVRPPSMVNGPPVTATDPAPVFRLVTVMT